MKVYKEHKYFIFELDDGKIVKYDLSNGETIGKLGKPVKNLNSQLRGHSIYSVINSFEDEKYKKFLKFILNNFVSNHISNIGTFLNYVNTYGFFEQYFVADITNISSYLRIPLNKVPKQLIKLCQQYNIQIDNDIIRAYNGNEGIFSSVLSLELEEISDRDRFLILQYLSNSYSNIYQLIFTHKYTPKALFKYMDHIIIHEALNTNEILRNLSDYANMMSKISSKFDRYPRNLLTTHQIAVRNYNRLKQEFDENAFRKRIKESLEWKHDKFVFIYPKYIQDIKDEAVMQNNCVASYVDRVINGECDILFMREKEKLDKSLVTLEIKNGKVIQQKGRFNRETTDEENIAIEKYNKFLNKQNNMIEAITC